MLQYRRQLSSPVYGVTSNILASICSYSQLVRHASSAVHAMLGKLWVGLVEPHVDSAHDQSLI